MTRGAFVTRRRPLWRLNPGQQSISMASGWQIEFVRSFAIFLGVCLFSVVEIGGANWKIIRPEVIESKALIAGALSREN